MTCIATAGVFIVLLKSIIPMTLGLSCNGLREIAVLSAEIMTCVIMEKLAAFRIWSPLIHICLEQQEAQEPPS